MDWALSRALGVGHPRAGSECITGWSDTEREDRGAMQECDEAAPTCTYGRFPIERDNAQKSKETGCRKATYHEDEDSGRQQAFEISSEVSALILLCSDSVRVAVLGTCTWYEWCGELMVIRTKTGLGQCEHCSCWCRGV